ncbi:MAG: hypothetical protein HIU81_04565 [Acidobacteria bacterium]|nr:hypothetical protein [Acidobacteriota bacterium]
MPISPLSTLLDARIVASKVPAVTVTFWIIKVLTTGMGETTSDYLVHTIDPVIGVVIGAVCFAIAILLTLRQEQYVAWAYWLAVVMVSVFGTMAADVAHIALGIPYLVSTVVFMVVLAAIFVIWYRVEGTLSIHNITSRRREVFYWLTVLTTFALGTAAGDLTATTFGLGYLGSGIMFAVVITIPALAYWKFRLPAIPAFWFAYIVTRPVGASFADWIAVSPERGGLDWGPGPVSLALAIIIAVLVAVLAKRTKSHGETTAAVTEKQAADSK